MSKNIGLYFTILGLVALEVGAFFGCIAGIQFLRTDTLGDILPFHKTRPLHVSLVVSWLFLGSIGGIYYYLAQHTRTPLRSPKLAVAHFWIFLVTGLLIILCYLLGIFGGREYWAFPPLLAIPIITSWVFFLYNFFGTLSSRYGFKGWPVFFWMWATGIVFFLFTFLEVYAWLIPYFRQNVIRDLMVQWKAYGTLVGSWNMLIYGTSIYVMDRISSKPGYATSRMAFFLYFLGLANLMLGWSHHIYIVPSAKWVRYLGYIISMTELIILAKMIWTWSRFLKAETKARYHLVHRFLLTTEFWIFMNLLLAILISVPAINVYTHGTHITVAHSMGSTIGINTMILLASVCYIKLQHPECDFSERQEAMVKGGYWIFSISLLLFWLGLVVSGILKGYYTIETDMAFQSVMDKIKPYLSIFLVSGIGVFVGLGLIANPTISVLVRRLRAE